MNKFLLAASFVLLNAFALPLSALAQSGPPVNPNLKEALSLIPIPGIQGAVNELFNNLKKVPSGDYMAKTTVNVPGVGDFPLQLYFFGDVDRQAIVLVVNRTIKMPGVFNNRVWKRLAGTTMTDPIFSVSTVDFSLDTRDMPAEFKQVVANSYYNVDSLDFTSGFQVASQVHIGGAMKTVIEVGMGIPVQSFTMRSGVVLPFPTNPQAMAGLAASVLADMKNVGKMAKDAPEFFVEFQLAPGKAITGPLGMSAITLTDASLSITSTETVGFKGNAILPGGTKKFITFFESPLSPAGAMDLLDFKFGLAAQSITLEDLAQWGIAMNAPIAPGGNFIKGLSKYQDKLMLMFKPLSVLQLNNPNHIGEYKFGDKSKPFPPLGSFNVLILGPLASVPDVNGKALNGPFLKAVGNGAVLGQKFASVNVYMGESGLHTKFGVGMNVKLGPLGKQGITLENQVDVSIDKQILALRGNTLGRVLELNMSPTHLTINSPATCLTPFSLAADVAITSNMNVASLMDSMPGVNADPARIPGCVGKELEQAYKWVATTGKDLGGYAASAANAELNKIADAAAAQLKKQEEAARREYEKTKNAARNLANNSANAANNALKEAENAFKGFGTKKKHKKGPDPKFASSVFDWDYYYDIAPDVVKSGVDLSTHWRDTGFNAGRRGSLEFYEPYYWSRYLDVQQLCHRGDRQCALQHWLDYGVVQGRQGSPDFSVADYLARNPKLRNTLGAENYEDALEHWLNAGEDEGRNGRPNSDAPGPVAGQQRIGGDGGGDWSDIATCAGQYVTGWRLATGRTVDRVQFRYPGGWAPVQGGTAAFTTDVTLPAGQYIVRVDYRSGGSVDSLSFRTNTGKTYGPYGGDGGSPGTYTVTPGEKLGCMRGRSGKSTDQLTFSSTGLR